MTRQESNKIIEDLKIIMEENDAIDIVVKDMTETSQNVDFFLIVTANSTTHMEALKDYVVKYFKTNKLAVKSFDKDSGFDWSVVDSGNIMVHVFSQKGREFYDLEELWGECPNI